MQRELCVVEFAAVLTMSAGSALGAPLRYAIQDIGALEGFTASRATAINADGQVTGGCSGGSIEHAIVYLPDGGGTLIDLGTLPSGSAACGYGINSLGHVAGISDDSDVRPRAFVDVGNGPLDIVGGNGGANVHAWGVNDAGAICGSMTNSGSGDPAQWRAMLWTPDPGHPDRYDGFVLPVLQGGDPQFTFATSAGINASGQIVGECFVSDGLSNRAVLWDDDPAHSIVALPHPVGAGFSLGNGINDAGLVVGMSYMTFVGDRAVIWSADAARTPTVLSPLPGDSDCTAMAVNNAGVVVGVSYTPQAQSRAFVYVDGQMFDLQSRLDASGEGWVLHSASSVNQSGQIVGSGAHHGQERGFVLTPVPGLDGDLDGDGDVDLADLSRLLTAFGSCEGDAMFDTAADVDGDGCVGLSDLSALLTDYGA